MRLTRGVITACALCATTAAVSATASAQLLQASATTPPDGCAIVQVFGDAALRNVVSQSSGSVTTGTLGMRYFGTNWTTVGAISVAGRGDTLRSGFGASLLPPASGRAFDAGLIDLRLHKLPVLSSLPYGDLTGLRIYGSASSSLWATDTAGGAKQRTYEVPVWGAGIGAYYQFFGGTINDSNQVTMMFDAGHAWRQLRGDLFSRSQDTATANQRAADRLALLGSGDRKYGGWEFGLAMQYSILNAGITYYYFPDRKGAHVDGLTGGQIVAGLGVRAVLASDWLSWSIGRPKRVDSGAVAAAALDRPVDVEDTTTAAATTSSRAAAAAAVPRPLSDRAACTQLARAARVRFVAPATARDTGGAATPRRDSTGAKHDTTGASQDSAPREPEPTARRRASSATAGRRPPPAVAAPTGRTDPSDGAPTAGLGEPLPARLGADPWVQAGNSRPRPTVSTSSEPPQGAARNRAYARAGAAARVSTPPRWPS